MIPNEKTIYFFHMIQDFLNLRLQVKNQNFSSILIQILINFFKKGISQHQ
jgi:hypothetical protein